MHHLPLYKVSGSAADASWVSVCTLLQDHGFSKKPSGVEHISFLFNAGTRVLSSLMAKQPRGLSLESCRRQCNVSLHEKAPTPELHTESLPFSFCFRVTTMHIPDL